MIKLKLVIKEIKLTLLSIRILFFGSWMVFLSTLYKLSNHHNWITFTWHLERTDGVSAVHFYPLDSGHLSVSDWPGQLLRREVLQCWSEAHGKNSHPTSGWRMKPGANVLNGLHVFLSLCDKLWLFQQSLLQQEDFVYQWIIENWKICLTYYDQ